MLIKKKILQHGGISWSWSKKQQTQSQPQKVTQTSIKTPRGAIREPGTRPKGRRVKIDEKKNIVYIIEAREPQPEIEIPVTPIQPIQTQEEQEMMAQITGVPIQITGPPRSITMKQLREKRRRELGKSSF